MCSAEGLNRANNALGRVSADQIKLELLAFAEIFGVRGAEKWQIGIIVA
jgi:hypothetical protein